MTNLRSITPPTDCPSCSFPLEWKNDLLYCTNPECYAKNSRRIEHWAKSLKIKGLGPATVDKLNLQSIEEIYQTDLVTMVERLGSEKLGTKLYNEIQISTQASLEELLPAFGIPLVGEAASKKLCKVINSIEEIGEETCKAAGLGPTATQNLLKWWESFSEAYNDLPFDYAVKRKQNKQNIGVICISGKLTSFKTKSEAKALLESLGYEVKDSLTKAVTILVNESGIDSIKTKKAKENGVLIVTNLKDYLGDKNGCITKMD